MEETSFENFFTFLNKLSGSRLNSKYLHKCKGASIYHVVRGGGRGVHEMTMNDHEGEGEGFRNDHVVRWTEFFCF